MKARDQYAMEVVPARREDQEYGYSWTLRVHHNRNQSTTINLTDNDVIKLALASLAVSPAAIQNQRKPR